MALMQLHALNRSGAVLAHGRPLRLQGRCAPGAAVTVHFAALPAITVSADGAGRWRAELPAQPPGGPHRLMAEAGSDRAEAEDLWLGELWLAAGQSNMEAGHDPSAGVGAAEREDYAVCQVRALVVPKQVATGPADDLDGGWQRLDPTTCLRVTAIGGLFAQHRHRATGMAIGVIHCAWGGTRIEAWTPTNATAAVPDLAAILARWQARDGHDRDADSQAGRAATAAWRTAMYHDDPGIAPLADTWHHADLDDRGWEVFDLPGSWESRGHAMDGAAWFRRRVALPPELVGHALVLSLGCADDFDDTWVNGERVGGLHRAQCFDAYQVLRTYPVPARLATAEVSLAVRVFDHFGDGGLTGPAPAMHLARADGVGARIDLTGPWRWRIERALPPKAWVPEPCHDRHHDRPGGLWNGMVAPLAGAHLHGVLWYQGESNADDLHALYGTQLTALIRAWRGAFAQPLPFALIELAPFTPPDAGPEHAPRWAAVQALQAAVAAGEPGCVLVSQDDAGPQADVHPPIKPLAAAACARAVAASHWR
jgi:sialate O-acetylesterase